jgi:hypothetical protein
MNCRWTKVCGNAGKEDILSFSGGAILSCRDKLHDSSAAPEQAWSEMGCGRWAEEEMRKKEILPAVQCHGYLSLGQLSLL